MADWQLLAPDEDARDLASTAREQFAALNGPAKARAAIDGSPPSDDGWPALVASGFPDIGVPEAFGGLGRLIDLVVVLEQAGRALLTDPLLASAIAYQTQVAADLHREEFRASPAAFGVARGTAAAGRCAIGRAHVFGGPAVACTLVVTGPDRAWVAVVDPAADGVQRLPGDVVMDPSRPVVPYRFDDAPCVDSREIPLADVEAVLARARICVAADLVGIAAATLDAAVAHALQRRQFGQPIGAFQAVKHQLADAYVAVERARSLTFGAALGSGKQIAPRDALLANATATEAAVAVTWRLTQLMGAMGVTFESDSHLYLRRAHQSSALFGSPDDLFLAAAQLERAAARTGTVAA